MSTRAQIKLKSDDRNFNQNDEGKIYIYKHSDGYPKGVLPVLVNFVKNFHENRGCGDGPYLLCQLVREFAIKEYIRNQENAETGHRFYRDWFEDKWRFLGWGLDTVQHGDIEFLYEIDSEGSIFVNGKKLTKTEIKKYLEETT